MVELQMKIPYISSKKLYSAEEKLSLHGFFKFFSRRNFGIA
jgi:hypothetical protein